MKNISKKARLTMEEKNADLQDCITPRIRNARRRLFSASEDGEEENFVNCCLEETNEKLEQSKQKWNFDFKNGEPLPGRYEWVKVDNDGNEISNSEDSTNRIQNSQTEQKIEKVENETEDTMEVK